MVKQQSQHWPDRRGFVSDQSDQNGGIQGAQKVLQNRTHINMLALSRVYWTVFFVKIQWVLLIKQQSQHWPNRGGS